MARITFNTTIDEGTQKLIGKWAVGLSKGQVIDAAVAMYDQAQGTEKKEIGDVVSRLDLVGKALLRVEDKVDSLLELGISVGLENGAGHLIGSESGGTAEERRARALAAVQAVGGSVVQPRRETSFERAERERREKRDRAASLDSVDDPSIDRSDEFVSG